MTQEQYTFPSRVGYSVLSVHDNWLGSSAANRRLTGSAAVIKLSRLTYPFRVPEIPRNPVRDVTTANLS